MQSLIGTNLTEITNLLSRYEGYRAKQLYNFIYKGFAKNYFNYHEDTFDWKKTYLPKEIIDFIKNNNYNLFLPAKILRESKSIDGTRKYLMELSSDKSIIETVLIPEEERLTLCISSQVGCSLSCTFCHTGTQKLSRQLTCGEILSQYVLVNSLLDQEETKKTFNIVFMGQGEPLYNYRQVKKSVQLLTDSNGINLGKNRITISTSGVAPLIPKIASELQVLLAISLHAPNDELRSKLMPINKIYPLSILMESCKDFIKSSASSRNRISFEYVLLRDVNDSKQCAIDLVRLINRYGMLSSSLINLIPFNIWPGTIYKPSLDDTVDRFSHELSRLGATMTLRKPRGSDILAACGQLKSSFDLGNTE